MEGVVNEERSEGREEKSAGQLKGRLRRMRRRNWEEGKGGARKRRGGRGRGRKEKRRRERFVG